MSVLMSLSSYAAYPSMEFVTTDGASHVIGASGLVITTDGENLSATNTDKDALTLPLASVVSMEFSDKEASVAVITAATGGEVTAYGIDGVEMGKFKSMQDAVSLLSPGIYLFKDDASQTVKIKVEK